MKKNYCLLVLLIGLFVPGIVMAQSCPTTGFSNSTSLFFFYNPAVSLCADRPLVVTVGENEFTLVECEPAYSVYDLTGGEPLSNPSVFLSDFGYASCEYTNGNLTAEILSVNEIEALLGTLKVYPNPLTSGTILNVKFSGRLPAEFHLYDATGKLIYAHKADVVNHQQIQISQIPNGIYFLKIGVNNLTETRKVIVMR